MKPELVFSVQEGRESKSGSTFIPWHGPLKHWRSAPAQERAGLGRGAPTRPGPTSLAPAQARGRPQNWRLAVSQSPNRRASFRAFLARTVRARPERGILPGSAGIRSRRLHK